MFRAWTWISRIAVSVRLRRTSTAGMTTRNRSKFPTHHVFMIQLPSLPNSFLKNRAIPLLKAIHPSLNPLTWFFFRARARPVAAPPFPRDRSAWMRPANSFMSEPETSWIIPRPYWARGPERSMSWLMRIFVPLPFRSSEEITVALACPLPFNSAPLAFITIRLAASSRSVMSTSPLNDSDTGPILMWTLPLYWWSFTTSVSSAPGMQGATRRGSRRNSQTSSVDAGTVNSFSRWIAMLFGLLLACFETLETPGAAEVVGLPAALELVPGVGGLHRHAAHRVDRLRPHGGGHRGVDLQPARGPELHQFGQDRHGDLFVGHVAQVESGRGMDPSDGL